MNDEQKKKLTVIGSIIGIFLAYFKIVDIILKTPKETETLLVYIGVGIFFLAIGWFITKRKIFPFLFIIFSLLGAFLYYKSDTEKTAPQEQHKKIEQEKYTEEEIQKEEIQKKLNLLAKSQGNSKMKKLVESQFIPNSEVVIVLGNDLVQTKKIERFISELYVTSMQDSIIITNINYNQDEKKYESLEIQKAQLD